MANSEQTIRNYVAAEKRKGASDAKIIVGITKLKGQAGKDAQKMVKAIQDAGLSPTQEIGKYFGLSNQSTVNQKTSVNKNPSIGQKLKSYATSAAMGLADTGAGIVQGVAYAGDKVNEGINSALGTNLSTSAYDDYNQEYQDANTNADNIRANAGRSGGDWVRGGTEIAATIPAFMVGGGAGQGVRQGAKFAGRQGAIGAGVGASRYAEDSGERMGNAALGGVGGAVGGVVGEKVVAPAIGKTVGAAMRKSANKSGRTVQAAEKLVDDAIAGTGINVSPEARTRLVGEASANLSRGKQIDANAAVRKSLLDDNGIQGTQAQISRNPSEWRTERELAKRSEPLNDVHVANNEQVASKWQSLADETGARPLDNNERMSSTFNTLRQGDEAAQADVSAKYQAAREMGGNDAQLNHMRFIDQTSRELEEQGLGSFLKGDIKGVFKGMFDNPDFVLTHGKSEEIVKILNARMRTTTDGNERAALGIVRKNLDNEVDNSIAELGSALPNGDPNGGLAGAQGAWNEARGAAKARFENIENNPALKAALDDVAPDKALDKFVLKANERDLIKLVDDLKAAPEGQQNLADLQGATIEHFLSKATQSNSGAFSPAGLNRAIESFGNNRMKALFSSDQIARINDIKAVSDILMQQPAGAHVNHSNTASVLINQMLGIANIAGKIPVLGNVAIGSAKAVGDLAQSGAGAKMINGQPAITKGSSLGLTEEQLQMLGLIPKVSGRVGAAMGAGASN